MPFVFVHGVNTRKNADYDREETVRAAFLREIVAPAVGIEPLQPIFTPYWGGNGVHFWRNLQVIPSGSEVETFGTHSNELPPSLGIAANEGAIQPGDTLDAVARREPGVAIDLIFDQAILEARTSEEIAALAQAYRTAQTRLQAGDKAWLAESNDINVLDLVFIAVRPPTATSGAETETFGSPRLWSMLKEGAKRLQLLSADQLSHAVVGLARRPLTHKIATFIGDAFQYLAERGDGKKPGHIAATVLASLCKASELAREKKEPLVVISHSFGGEIVYDILTHYANDTDLEIDVWVTVGSQVGLFEEMSLLWTSPGRVDPTAVPQEAITSPQRVKRWLNIVDTNDVLGFLVLPTFTAATAGTVNDFTYNTGYAVNGAHSGYFKWPSFYRRLAQRIGEKG
ncbi:hypothetical protein CSQ96_21365 [Janthinobacterium sp. BJB412]|nr:hypothetical protein CSQ96_21365 [Janthinobacterium sp. BJB412]